MAEIAICIVKWLSTFGYLGLVITMFLNGFPGFPPSEVTMPLYGIVVASDKMSFLSVILFAAASNTLGTSVYYFIGRCFGLKWHKKLLSSSIKGTLLNPIGLGSKSILKVIKLYDNYGPIIILLGRNIPLIRSVISIPAGMARMNFMKFLSLTFAGMLSWITIWTYLGFTLKAYPKNIDTWIGVTALLIIYLLIRIKTKYSKRKEEKL